MGQKFTITEQERNQIRGLYEQSFGEVTQKESLYSQIGNGTDPHYYIKDKGDNNYTLVYRDEYFRQLLEFKSINFQGSPQIFSQINQAFKTMFNSNVGSEKKFNLGKNVITLKVSNRGQEKYLIVFIQNEVSASGYFTIEDIEKIDQLFPSESKNLDNESRKNEIANIKTKRILCLIDSVGTSASNNPKSDGKILVDPSQKSLSIEFTDVTLSSKPFIGNFNIIEMNHNGDRLTYKFGDNKVNGYKFNDIEIHFTDNRATLHYQKGNMGFGYRFILLKSITPQ